MSTTYQVERWHTYNRDCQDLWVMHYNEIAVDKERMPMHVDVPRFQLLDASGSLIILTARDAGTMIGYFLAVIAPHPHYADILCGFEDSYYMAPDHRKGFAGVRLIKEAEKVMKARGVKKVFMLTKAFKDLGLMFERLGYDKCDIAYSKWIGD